MWHAGFFLKVDKSGLNMALTTDWAAKLASCLEKFAHISKHGCVFVRVYVKIVYVYSIIYKSVCVCERVRFLSVCVSVLCVSYPTVHLYSHTITQLYIYTTAKLHSCTSVQVRNYTTVQLKSYTTVQVDIQIYNSTLQPAIEVCNHTTIQLSMKREPQGNSAALLHQKETTGEWLHLDLVHCRSVWRWSKDGEDGEDGEAVNGIQSVRPGRPRLLLQCPMSAYQGAPPNGWIKEHQLKRGRKTQGTKSMKRGKQQKRDENITMMRRNNPKNNNLTPNLHGFKKYWKSKNKFFHSSLSPSFKSSNVNFGLTRCEVHTPLRGTGKVDCQQKQVAVWSVILAQESSIEHGCVCVYSFLCLCVCTPFCAKTLKKHYEERRRTRRRKKKKI